MTNVQSLNRRYVRISNVVATDLAGNTLLLDAQQWAYFEFDRIASTIWAHLETPCTLPALVEALRGGFDVDEARCLHDTKHFLDDMIAQGLVTVVAD